MNSIINSIINQVEKDNNYNNGLEELELTKEYIMNCINNHYDSLERMLECLGLEEEEQGINEYELLHNMYRSILTQLYNQQSFTLEDLLVMIPIGSEYVIESNYQPICEGCMNNYMECIDGILEALEEEGYNIDATIKSLSINELIGTQGIYTYYIELEEEEALLYSDNEEEEELEEPTSKIQQLENYMQYCYINMNNNKRNPQQYGWYEMQYHETKKEIEELLKEEEWR